MFIFLGENIDIFGGKEVVFPVDDMLTADDDSHAVSPEEV